jgi:hypothetical protein
VPENAPIPLDASPAARIAAAIDVFGEAVVAERAAGLLAGSNEGEEFLLWVGGQHAQGILDGAPALYWPEVWGARALLFAWDDTATDTVEKGLSNQAWRVREMCCRVAIERALAVQDAVAPLLEDSVARVRAGAARLIATIGSAEQVAQIKPLLRDSDIEVRRAAGGALKQATERLGHPID